jgi:cytosine/adenosine deaminase-related metal-dependent hydrolase
MFMFNVTCKIRKIMQSGINVSIGTDSSATGSINLLEEMRFARTIFRKMYNQDLDPRTITEMVTVNPARALRMGERTGSLAEGKLADLLLIEAAHEDPYENLLHADMADIELLTYEGAPLYSSERFEPLFTMYGKNYTKIRVNGRDKLIVGDPGALLQKIRAAVGYDKTLSFMPIDI